MNVIKPSPQYLTKLRLVIAISAVSLLVLGVVLALFAGLLESDSLRATRTLQLVITVELIGIPNALILSRITYDHRAYEINPDAIIIHSGAWSESTCSFPLDSVVSFRTQAGWLDARLGIGTLEVLVTSRRSVTGTRLRLSGLEDPAAAARLLDSLLQRVRDERLSGFGYATSPAERSLLSVRH
jgi:membrane protein YdbS with pleckstrin-like domain